MFFLFSWPHESSFSVFFYAFSPPSAYSWKVSFPQIPSLCSFVLPIFSDFIHATDTFCSWLYADHLNPQLQLDLSVKLFTVFPNIFESRKKTSPTPLFFLYFGHTTGHRDGSLTRSWSHASAVEVLNPNHWVTRGFLSRALKSHVQVRSLCWLCMSSCAHRVAK